MNTANRINRSIEKTAIEAADVSGECLRLAFNMVPLMQKEAGIEISTGTLVDLALDYIKTGFLAVKDYAGLAYTAALCLDNDSDIKRVVNIELTSAAKLGLLKSQPFVDLVAQSAVKGMYRARKTCERKHSPLVTREKVAGTKHASMPDTIHIDQTQKKAPAMDLEAVAKRSGKSIVVDAKALQGKYPTKRNKRKNKR